ncbi:MAG TPA: hypothetical protein VF520_02635 [Thermoleophilaceae bacterium]|jgi:hypothetical protein
MSATAHRSEAQPQDARTRWDRALKVSALAYLIGFSAHGADHVARGLDGTPDATFWAGTIGLVPATIAVGLVFAGHRFAAPYAVFVGLFAAIGASLVHFPGDWSTFSEPWRGGTSTLDGSSVSVADWATLIAMIAGAFAFAVFGALAAREARQPPVALALER